MGVPGNADLLLLRSAAAEGGYTISRSLRFNASDSAYLSRTPASAGNRKKWTWAGWVKRSRLGSSQTIFAAVQDFNNGAVLNFTSSDQIQFFNFVGGAYSGRRITTPVYRDASAWYHILLVWDSANSTSANRIRLYVNGLEVTTFGTTGDPSSSDSIVNSTNTHYIGADVGFNDQYGNQYLADVFFIDGQALDPSSFVETSATTGRLEPKQYAGSFGTNGFWLKFSDNSAATATTLGKDYSGNSNNWTPNNLSVTAGAGNDSLTDTPSSYGTDTGAGGEVRGNYATLNPLVITTATTLANGNLDVTSSGQLNAVSTIVPSSNKWYLEITLGSIVTNSFIGLYGTTPLNSSYCVYGINGYGFLNTGWGSASSTVSGTGVAGDVIGLALDVDARTLQYYKNGSSIGTISNFTFVQNWSIGISCNATVSTPWIFNFGQRPFAYPVSGFKALCDTNLPAPVVAKSDQFFQTVLWTGDTSTTRSITGLNFSPDLVWVKNRGSAYWNVLFDSVRGAGNQLSSNQTDAELASASNVAGKVSSFDANGFTLASGSSGIYTVNENAKGHVAWCFDAGSNTVSNTAGSITSQVRANASAGFSVVAWTKSPAGAHTVGHGLGVAPQLVIVKSRSLASEWAVYHSALGATKFLKLNTTDAAGTVSAYWNDTAPTSTTISLGSWSNLAGDNIAYCFAPVAGYSSFGSYTGNGSATDGPFVFCGFRPRWLLLKNTTQVTNWYLVDAARNTYNVVNSLLRPNLSNAELSGVVPVDFLSNGFKIRDNDAGSNASGETIVYAAFAENPFQYARAR